MAIDKEKLFDLPSDEKRELAFALLDSIDEEFVHAPLPEWKINLIRDRVQKDIENPADTLPWSEVRRKYNGQ